MARMAVQAKICGISTPEAFDAAVNGGASHVGFVFFAKSPRNVEPPQAASLARRGGAQVRKVGLFVNPDIGFLRHTTNLADLDTIQLHGSESPALVAQIKAETGLEIWKAVAVRTRSDLADAVRYRGAADRILYDAKPPPGSALPGGNGLRFDWKLIEGHRHPLPWILSGGLDEQNVKDAIGITGARIVDVSSGVESAPGVKEVDKIAAFLKAVGSL
jgi:phosphoribosylanthranilate isomerase